MTHSDDPKDQDWLIALRGEEGHQLSDEESRTADAIRLALQRRAEEIDKVVPTPTRASLDKIRQELRRNETRTIGKYSSSRRIWAVAASLIVVSVLTMLFIPRLAERTYETIPHFAPVANIMAVTDPRAMASEIIEEVTAAGAPWVLRGGRVDSEEVQSPGNGSADVSSPDITRRDLEDGSVVLQIPATENNIQVLREYNLEPEAHDGMIKLIIVPEPPK